MFRIENMKSLFPLVASFFLHNAALAFSAVAWIDDSPVAGAAWNWETQKQANSEAKRHCEVQAEAKGYDKEKCQVGLVGKQPGFGALSCGEKLCAAVTSAKTAQTAVDEAYNLCTKNKANKNCNVVKWEDWEGFASAKRSGQARQQSGNQDCRPRTAELRCSSQCVNGDCTVSYENGCKMRVQISPKFNPFNNRWDYPAPSC